jgi:N-acetyl-gamma-glutamylphosphate reductase
MKKKKQKPYQITQKQFRDRLTILKNIVDIQSAPGTCDFSPYMHGMANGLILALSCMENTDPDFIEIETYLHEQYEKKGKKHVRNKRSRRRK